MNPDKEPAAGNMEYIYWVQYEVLADGWSNTRTSLLTREQAVKFARLVNRESMEAADDPRNARVMRQLVSTEEEVPPEDW